MQQVLQEAKGWSVSHHLHSLWKYKNNKKKLNQTKL